MIPTKVGGGSTTFTFHYVSILIYAGKIQVSPFSLFTFHYVSILMGEGSAGIYYGVGFTFHYVSILIILSDDGYELGS